MSDFKPHKMGPWNEGPHVCSECNKAITVCCVICAGYVCEACHEASWAFVTDCGHKGVESGPCENEECQECCMHDERDHYICLSCGHEGDPGEDIDAAMDAMEDR